MANNSYTEVPPNPDAVVEKETTTTTTPDGSTVRKTVEVDASGDKEPVTVTTTTSRGFPDVIPTLIPALQSSSYVLVILAAFLAWSSRKLARDFFHKHIELVETLRSNTDEQIKTTQTQMEVLKQISENNAGLVSTNAKLTETNTTLANIVRAIPGSDQSTVTRAIVEQVTK